MRLDLSLGYWTDRCARYPTTRATGWGGTHLTRVGPGVPARWVALLGDRERIADRMTADAESGATSLALHPLAGTLPERIAAIRIAAEALDIAGVGS